MTASQKQRPRTADKKASGNRRGPDVCSGQAGPPENRNAGYEKIGNDDV